MPPEDQDLYAILNVAPDASQTQIGRAYRRLIRAHHPDIHPDRDSAALAAAIAAYAILRDPARRAAYDQARCPTGNQHPTRNQHPTGNQHPTRNQHPTGNQHPTRNQHPTAPPHRPRPEPDIRAGPVRWYPK